MMIKKMLSVVFLFAVIFAQAQVPQKINYQSVVRNSAGVPLTNRMVNLRFTIHDGSEAGAIAYQETDTAISNEIGLITVVVGGGNIVQGTLSGVNWGVGNKYLQVELDVNGGTAFVNMGTSQLLSVPYALYAGNGPAGPTGATGPVGPVGATGTTGATGATGPGVANGTVNFITKFTPDGQSLGNSIAFDNGSKIGIGTVMPASLVHISTDGTLANGLRVSADGSGTFGPSVLLQSSTTQWAIYGSNGGSDAGENKFVIRDYTRSANRVVIDTSGNVGIGTTTPKAMLEVNGNVRLSNLSGTGGFLSVDAFGNVAKSNPVSITAFPNTSGIINTSGYSIVSTISNLSLNADTRITCSAAFSMYMASSQESVTYGLYYAPAGTSTYTLIGALQSGIVTNAGWTSFSVAATSLPSTAGNYDFLIGVNTVNTNQISYGSVSGWIMLTSN